MSKKNKVVKLAELPATAICGNDISSSVLYVSALSIIAAGQYAWVALLIVAGILLSLQKDIWRSGGGSAFEWRGLQRPAEHDQ